MKASSFLVALITLAALGTACGRTTTPAPGTPSPLPSPTATPVVPGDRVAEELRINDFEAPATAQVGVPVTFTVIAVLPNSCTEFDHLELAVDDAAGQVTARAHGTVVKEAVCTQILAFYLAQTTFTPKRAGTYRLTGPMSDITATIEVR